ICTLEGIAALIVGFQRHFADTACPMLHLNGFQAVGNACFRGHSKNLFLRNHARAWLSERADCNEENWLVWCARMYCFWAGFQISDWRPHHSPVDVQVDDLPPLSRILHAFQPASKRLPGNDS